MDIPILPTEIIMKIFESVDRDTLANSIMYVLDDQWFWKRLTLKHFGEPFDEFPELLEINCKFNWRVVFTTLFQLTSKYPKPYGLRIYKTVPWKDLIFDMQRAEIPPGKYLSMLLEKTHRLGLAKLKYHDIRRLFLTIISEKVDILRVFLLISDFLELFEYFTYTYSVKQNVQNEVDHFPFKYKYQTSLQDYFVLKKPLNGKLSLSFEETKRLIECLRKLRLALKHSFDKNIEELFNENDLWSTYSLKINTAYFNSSLKIVDACERLCEVKRYDSCVSKLKNIYLVGASLLRTGKGSPKLAALDCYDLLISNKLLKLQN